jgi:hypothetical protein
MLLFGVWKIYNIASYPPPLLPLEPKGKRRKGWKGEKESKIHHIFRTADQKWLGVRIKVGGANLNFEVRLRGKIIIFKIKKIPRESAWKTDSNDIFLRNPLFMQGPYYQIGYKRNIDNSKLSFGTLTVNLC